MMIKVFLCIKNKLTKRTNVNTSITNVRNIAMLLADRG